MLSIELKNLSGLQNELMTFNLKFRRLKMKI